MPDINIMQTVDTWIEVFQQKSFRILCIQPSANSWSLGQVGMHLIEATGFYLRQIAICVNTNDDANETMSASAIQLFKNNELPDVQIEGPETNANTPQPVSKEALLDGLNALKEKIQSLEMLMAQSQFKGKTRHPGLLFFNAEEWMQFADIHLRHHVRQLKRIEAFLDTA